MEVEASVDINTLSRSAWVGIDRVFEIDHAGKRDYRAEASAANGDSFELTRSGKIVSKITAKLMSTTFEQEICIKSDESRFGVFKESSRGGEITLTGQGEGQLSAHAIRMRTEHWVRRFKATSSN